SDTISQYERGIRNPNLTTISEIARVLKCSVSDLV
ncbi:MAG: helix-turn-helix transcriptional regulator, partial [Clostridia bacterium]|nr:helix-turn-helix transcriptional regulator [Clostridia bacterium]